MKQSRGFSNVMEIVWIRKYLLAGETMSESKREEHHFLFVTEGKIIVRYGDYREVINDGELLILPASARSYTVKAVIEPSEYYDLAFVTARVTHADGKWRITETSPPLIGKIKDSGIPFIRHHFIKLYQLWKEEGAHHISLQIRWLELWEELHKADENHRHHLDTLLKKMVTHMEKHYADHFQIEEMARYSGVTPTLFYKKFKEYTSLTPLQFVTKCRMDKARKLLVDNRAGIAEVAQAVGYQDLYYFNRMFKKTVGLPPSRYQKKLSKRIAVLNPALYSDLLALGVSQSNLIPCWGRSQLRSAYKQDESLGLQLGIEQLRELKPDWIVGSKEDHSPMYERLSHIAATKLLSFKPSTWQDHLYALADMLEVRSVAERWMHYYTLKLETVRERLRQKFGEQTILVARVTAKGRCRVIGTCRRKLGKLLYEELMLRAPTSLQDVSFIDLENIEQLNDFHADHVLLIHDHALAGEENLTVTGSIYHANVFPWMHYSALGHDNAISESLILFHD